MSHLLYVGGGEDADLPVDLPLPPILALPVNQVYDVAWLDGQLVRLVGRVVIHRLTLPDICECVNVGVCECGSV